MSDAYSKWVELVPVPDKAMTVAKAIFSEWICRHSTPSYFITDGGREYDNQVLDELLKLLESKHHVISPLHPQAKGQSV